LKRLHRLLGFGFSHQSAGAGQAILEAAHEQFRVKTNLLALPLGAVQQTECITGA